MSLKYPLRYYDEAGRFKTPLYIYLLMLFSCRALFVLIVALSYRQDSEGLLSTFYPNNYHFYQSLIPMLPALLVLIIVSKRNAFWTTQKYFPFKFILPLTLFALLSDIAVQINILYQSDFNFSLVIGLSILVALSGILYIFRSAYFYDVLKDWQGA